MLGKMPNEIAVLAFLIFPQPPEPALKPPPWTSQGTPFPDKENSLDAILLLFSPYKRGKPLNRVGRTGFEPVKA